MKNLKVVILLLLLSIFACANEYDKKILNNIYENVVLKDIKKAVIDIEKLENSIQKNENIKESFKELIKSWKSVESFYILGDLDEEFIDTPRLIDIFHNGNEDITKQLDFALKSNDEAKIALFKNSLKSINALEYIIHTKDLNNKRVQEFALVITKRIKTHLQDINEAYKEKKENIFKNVKKSNSIVINSLVQNSYKLKEWRIADVMGLTKKYENNPDNNRAEYTISKNSVLAISAILSTYKNILDNPDFEDYGDYLIKLTNGKKVNELRKNINEALVLTKEIKDDNLLQNKKLYTLANNIHVILFVDVIEDLQISAKILDADGD